MNRTIHHDIPLVQCPFRGQKHYQTTEGFWRS